MCLGFFDSIGTHEQVSSVRIKIRVIFYNTADTKATVRFF